ncbi:MULTISPECIES: glycine--tRNA ligase subunit beta [unclassified Coleofasciculus]|uniref:glycine--tRNA ligase subunit beta n=1 Tax=Cyanophyceae TaxID=3028117 RepID=UPI001688AF84|nr:MULTISPECIES: glycine--tRNA ligase subunit beta [unclassified Coleofasciculus]MBD1881024.1 glycine--tRNA ligase subunit beta [Coleofasciculus sp. FACHB-T130]MBD1900695.1 glycine--tRNA ligase subunit beta [Coleofasciculus sp. FACHB-125]
MSSFLLEVGTEELPASFVNDAIAQWRSRIPASLTENSLAHEAIEVYGTPRRLAVLIKGLPTQQPDREEEVKGPPAQAAFKDGQPTKAAEGFARKLGVEVNALEIRPTDKGDFVFVRQTIAGRPTAEILTQLVSQWIFGLEGKRLMRWGDGDIKFPRPIEWLVALLNDAVLPIELVNGSETIKSDRITRAHRVLHPESVTISQADDYVDSLRSASVEVNPESRQTKIREQVQAAAQKMDGYTEIYPDLLQEVTHLVEFPTAVVGKFDSEFLSLPTEVITTVMVTHQRYFPVFKTEKFKELLPYFITISNGDPAKSDIIAEGNARVIRARLADGQYFYKADLSQSLENYLPQLEKVTFQESLGSVREKVERLVKIAGHINEQLQLGEDERNNIERATLLCKADLVTQMVGEFPELQGIMGQKYALASGEPEAVATAIIEHYLPRGAGDSLPQTITGQVVALADRLDTLVSIFGLGMLPTGSSDPFALRRAANAVINITWAADLPINLHQLLQKIVADFVAKYPKTKSEELVRQLQEFFLQRIRNLLQDERNTDYDLVNAVLGENDPEYTERALKDLLDVRDRALFLQTIRNNGKLNEIYETVNRSTRLAAQGDLDKAQLQPETVVSPELFQKASEQAFYDALVQIVPQTQASQEQRNYQLLVDGLAQIAPTVSTFFDGAESVLVMDADPNIKRNRLNILGLLRNHARVLADFGAIVKS